jgi:hypothetical protein
LTTTCPRSGERGLFSIASRDLSVRLDWERAADLRGKGLSQRPKGLSRVIGACRGVAVELARRGCRRALQLLASSRPGGSKELLVLGHGCEPPRAGRAWHQRAGGDGARGGEGWRGG